MSRELRTLGDRGLFNAGGSQALAGAIFFEPETTTWTAPHSGIFMFHLWGGGGIGSYSNTNAGSGAYSRKTLNLSKGDVVSLTIGNRAVTDHGEDTTMTFDGVVVTAGGGKGGLYEAPRGAGGVASGGDININGNEGSQSVLGANSPPAQGGMIDGFYGYRTNDLSHMWPGTGGGSFSGTAYGGTGGVIIHSWYEE